MKRMWTLAVAALISALLLSGARAAEPSKKADSDEGKHGTAVAFVDSPSEAARLAASGTPIGCGPNTVWWSKP
jgi:hypothetical protein